MLLIGHIFIIYLHLVVGQDESVVQPPEMQPPEMQPPEMQPPGQPLPPTQPPPPPPVNYTRKPEKKEWVKGYKPNEKYLLLDWLIEGCWPLQNCTQREKRFEPIEYEGYDGFYNNPAHPELGAVDTPLLRRVPAAYEDGVYKPSGQNRPEPIELSEQILNQPQIGSHSRTGKTALLVFFGQQVVEEILDAQRPACPPEYFNLNISKSHRYYNYTGHTVLPVLRTRYDMRTGFSPNNPRQQLNEITPWIDGGLTYGTTKTWSDQLRRYENGTFDENGLLATTDDELFPAINTIRLPMANPPPPFHHSKFIKRHEILPINRFFKLGNPRGNENPFLLSFGILWFRWHNHIARHLRMHNPDWNGEKIYNEARKWVIATHQHIVINKWLPKWLGEYLPDYNGYNPSIDPQIDQFFQSAAMRFGHTLVTPGVYLRDYGRNGCNINLNGWNYKAVRTCNNYWRPQDSITAKYNGTSEPMDIDRLLMGMAFQLSEEEDHKIVEDLRGNVFGPLEFSRRDLMALNIQRARDHGLPDYNTVREAYGLQRVTSWSHFPNSTNDVKEAFMRLYNNSFDDVDLWVGGILETTDGPGELFKVIIKDQFTRIRDGDRFWYRNKANKLFTEKQIERIEQLTIYDIIMSVTQMDYSDIQDDPFSAPQSKTALHRNCRDKPSFLVDGQCKRMNETVFKPCFYLKPLTSEDVDNCTDPGTYDYFSNSEVSYVLTFLLTGLVSVGFGVLLLILLHRKQKVQASKIERIAVKIRESFRTAKKQCMPYSASEWVDRKAPQRPVVVIMDSDKKQVQVRSQKGELLRAMDLSNSNLVEVYVISDNCYLMLKVSNDYDLILKFESDFLREAFLQGFEVFIGQLHVARNRISMALNPALKQAITRQDRQKRLEMFFRVVFAQAFEITHSEEELLKLDAQAAREIIYTEITKNEFAEALSMKSDSEFVQKMFNLVDKDRNGFISFREFVDILIIFAKGTADDKAKLMFDIYDINKTGVLTKEDFKNMIKSLMETVNADVEQQDLDQVIDDMMRQANMAQKDAISVQDFQRLLLDYKDKVSYAQLVFSGIPGQAVKTTESTSKRSVSFVETARQTADNLYSTGEFKKDHQALQAAKSIDDDQEMVMKNTHSQPSKPTLLLSVRRVIENHSREIFWVTLYTLVLWAIFAERAYYYSVEREHSGLRRIAGYGVTVTRGAASAMMFTYSSLLVTMCFNTITILRDTFLHIYIPFDKAVLMHKYIAMWALFFSVMHVIGHAFNFYSISTQTSDDLTCLFRNFFHSTHEIPKFHYWCWQTITGVTGILLTLLTALIFVFAHPVARRHLYNAFWFTHMLYPMFYMLIILHGAGRLIQEPFFYYFFLGPCILFAMDRLVTISRKKVEVPVLKAELLPSDVTLLEFKRPQNFEYKSGQWVRIACPALNNSEYHPFTLSSAPNEVNLTVHIRAVGPWTTNIRRKFDPSLLREKPLPKIHLEGPYGEGHQDWYQYEVSVLIGGGIGVTPFASILKDIVFRSNNNSNFSCKKVYFLWVTKTQKQFEWLVDIIRELETADTKKTVSVHIFISQFYQKFDLRTILLYICERHFQRVRNRSLFTGLHAVTHFGRPHFDQFFKSLQSIHRRVRKVGVFSCGPPPMTKTVDKSCVTLNKSTVTGPIFQHFFKNF